MIKFHIKFTFNVERVRIFSNPKCYCLYLGTLGIGLLLIKFKYVERLFKAVITCLMKKMDSGNLQPDIRLKSGLPVQLNFYV